MNIYKAESDVKGLAERIKANVSVAYDAEITPWDKNEMDNVHASYGEMGASRDFLKPRGVKASVGDFDLYYTRSIFVTTNWNRNDDVFTKTPVWAARHTPSHKKTNLEHDEKQLVGHITDVWALDGDGNIINDSTVIDEIPELFHLANGAVIYTKWEDDALNERAAELIQQIEAGEKFVSMEALFNDFDYAIITPENQFHVVGRAQDTAFLTKHLRCYGGSGEYDGCRLGRLLKNIVFSGKGYVDKPANPYSVIFNDAIKVDFSKASLKNPFNGKTGVSIFCSHNSENPKNIEETQMSDTLELLKAQVDELKEQNKTLAARLEESTKASSEGAIANLKSEVESLTEKVEASDKSLTEALAKVDELTTANETLTTELGEANDAKAKLEEQVATAEAEKVTASRVSRLVDGGYDREVATAKVETFAGLSDEQFEAVATELVEAKKTKDDEKKEEKKEDAKASDESSDEDDPSGEATASETDLEDTETQDEAPLSADASADESDDDTTREELASAFANFFGYGEDSNNGE